MELKVGSMKFNLLTKTALFAAIFWSILSFGFIIFAFQSGKNPYGPLSLIVHGSLIFYLLLCGIYIRLKYNNLSFSFKEALKYSVLIGVLGNFIFLLLGFIYLNATWEVNFPIYIESMTDLYTSMEQSGELERIGEVDKNAISKNIESLKIAKPWNIVFNDFSMKMIISLILSFIIAVTMRKTTS